jgi:hypothetical protein
MGMQMKGLVDGSYLGFGDGEAECGASIPSGLYLFPTLDTAFRFCNFHCLPYGIPILIWISCLMFIHNDFSLIS